MYTVYVGIMVVIVLTDMSSKTTVVSFSCHGDHEYDDDDVDSTDMKTIRGKKTMCSGGVM